MLLKGGGCQEMNGHKRRLLLMLVSEGGNLNHVICLWLGLAGHTLISSSSCSCPLFIAGILNPPSLRKCLLLPPFSPPHTILTLLFCPLPRFLNFCHICGAMVPRCLSFKTAYDTRRSSSTNFIAFLSLQKTSASGTFILSNLVVHPLCMS